MRARWMWNISKLMLSVWYEGIAMPLSLSYITTESQWRHLVLTIGGDYWHVYISKKPPGVKYREIRKKPPIAVSRLAY